MDCQILMAAFTFVFYWSFVATSNGALTVMQTVSGLPLHQQLDLLNRLQELLQPVVGDALLH